MNESCGAHRLTADARGQRLAGWSAIGATAFCVATLATSLVASGADVDGILDPGKALNMAPYAQRLFRLSMLADCIGFYFLPAVSGAYLWARLRTRHGPRIDIAAVCLVIYATLGIVGASMSASALPVLSAGYTVLPEPAQLARQASWLTLVYATQRGVWLLEMLPLTFWCLITGSALRDEFRVLGRLLQLVGLAWCAVFILGSLGYEAPAQAAESAGLLLTPVWFAFAGGSLLRRGHPPGW